MTEYDPSTSSYWVAADYVRYRPRYPADLFEHVTGLPEQHDLAWDCATGNGQAAVDLAARFERVVATDIDPEQIEHALPHPRVEYRHRTAYDGGLEAQSVDLVTVASAMHWFDTDRFFEEVRRVLRPGGILAVWSYDGRPEVSPAVDEIVARIRDEAVADHFPPGFEHVRSRYATLHLPFAPLEAPSWAATATWTADEMIGHVRSWSGVRRCIQDSGVDPVTPYVDRLRAAWPVNPATPAEVRWPLFARLSRRER